MLNLPLMYNNINRDDLNTLINFLKKDDPILTQSSNVKAFEKEWSKWLWGTKKKKGRKKLIKQGMSSYDREAALKALGGM